MKRLCIVLSVLACIFCGILPGNGYATAQTDAIQGLFADQKTAPQFKALAIKNLTKSETLKYSKTNRHEFLGVRKLVDILGPINGPDRRISFTAHYMYITDGKPVIATDTATWYYFISKKNQKPIYGLYYPTNEITKRMDENDLLIIGRVSDSEIYVMLVDKDSKRHKDFLSKLGYEDTVKQEKPSFWSRLWGTSTTVDEEYELEPTALPVPPVAQDSWTRIYFTPGPECEDNIIAEINKAKKVDIAVYSITNKNIYDAIVAAKARGAKVRIITDYLQSKGKQSLVDKLRAEGFPVETNKVNGKLLHKIMHTKVGIFDDKYVVSGSYNWTTSATESNVEVCMFFPQPEEKKFTNFFEKLWKQYKE